MSILLLRRFSPFSTGLNWPRLASTLDEITGEIPAAEDIVGVLPVPDCCSECGPDDADWVAVGRLPPALSTDFKSLDSTLSELPVESLVMVTEPELFEEQGGFKEDVEDALEEVVEVVKEVELGEPEVPSLLLIRCPEAAKPEEESLVTMLDIELLEDNDDDEADDDFTGEMVTLLLLLSFLWGELEPNKRPSSSSTLSKVEESIVLLVFTVLESSLVLKPLVVRLFKSTKSLGFSNIL